jgi:hypothetical protein
MRRAGDILLLALQWALILVGIYGVIGAVHFYQIEAGWVATQPPAEAGADAFRPPTFLRMIQGITTGLIAMGLGGVLYYLRRLYLSRRQ